jgi:hypothetical protein
MGPEIIQPSRNLKSKHMKTLKSLKELSKIGKDAFFEKRIIDTDLEPTCEPYMRIVEHIKMGKIDLSKLNLFYSQQQIEFAVKGGMYRRYIMKNQNVMNATVWDKFMLNPSLIPESWKKDPTGRRLIIISFFATIFAHPNGSLYVRTMYFYEKENTWKFGDHCINDYWECNNPVVVLAD